MKKFMKFMVLSGLTLSCSLMATEFRAPLILERGPLRYDFDIKAEKWSLNMWNAVYRRNADKAFIKHGTDTKTFTNLFFNSDSFKIAEIFGKDENGFDFDQTFLFKNSNPFVLETRIAPRAVYQEHGVVMGGRFEYPIWDNKGRIGVRATVPFRTVRVERDDESECSALPTQDLRVTTDQTFIRGDGNTGVAVTGIHRYKLALLNRLKYFGQNGQILCALNLHTTVPVAAAGNVSMFGNRYDGADASTYIGKDIPFVVMKGSSLSANGGNCSVPKNCNPCPCDTELTGVPFGAPTGVTTFVIGETTVPERRDSTSNAARVEDSAFPFGNGANEVGQIRFGANIANSATRLKNLPANGVVDDGVGYAFVSGTDYSKLSQQPGFDDLWASSVTRGDNQGFGNGASGNEDLLSGPVNSFIENLISGKDVWADPYCWLKENCGTVMQSNERIGIGDIDVDFFYEHTFNDQWRVEGMFGVRFPTGTQNRCNNLFAVALGNSGHYEVKIGGMGVWQPIDWMNIKLDLMYSFVLSHREKVHATFKGSCIKGFGPCVPADVDWGYFLGHVDFNFFYCKADLSTTVGYELYYKTKDSICYKCNTTTCHCLGQVWTNGNGTPITCNTQSAQIVNPSFQDFNMQLDGCAAARGTERIAHRLRFETHWRATKCLSLYMGGAYTFAGKNMPQEADVHAGITVYY